MPLEPYPTRYARHLPLEGKALSIVILFPHMCVLALTLWGKRYSRIVAFPAWGRGTAPAVDRVLSLTAHLRRIFHLFHLSFIPPVPYPPLQGTFPSRGRLTIREYRHLTGRRSRHLPPWERRCIEKSGILVSQPSPLGKGDRAAVDRVLSFIGALETHFPFRQKKSMK